MRNPALQIPPTPKRSPEPVPNPCKSPLKFPNPPRVAAAFPATDPPPRRSRCRDFQIHPRCFVSPPLCYCRHELSRPARHRGPSRACEARGSLPRKSPLVERRRPLFLAAPALCWCLSGVGVEIHPGVDRFLSVRWFSSSSAEDQSTKVHEPFVSPRIRGVQLNPHARR